MVFNAAVSTDKIPLETDVLCNSFWDNIDLKCSFFINSEKKIFLYLGIEEKKKKLFYTFP